MTLELLENPANFSSLVATAQQSEGFPAETSGALIQLSLEVQTAIKEAVA